MTYRDQQTVSTPPAPEAIRQAWHPPVLRRSAVSVLTAGAAGTNTEGGGGNTHS
jgi:hypothetical protein